MKTGTKLAALGALAAGACILRSEYEKERLTVHRYTVFNEKIPEAFDGVRIAVLADLHGKCFGAENKRLYDLIERIRPDYILSAGDLVLKTRPWETGDVAEFLGRLTGLCPVYCGNGNHELELRRVDCASMNAYERYTRLLIEKGVTVLSDASAVLRKGNDAIDVTGLDLGLAYYAKGFHVPMRADYIPRKLGKPEPGRFHILLGHYPNYFSEYAVWGADLVLAGHMHGGTVRLPWAGGLMSPNYEFFPAYDRGYFEKGQAVMIVSGGLGTHSVNIRFGRNYPEIPVIELKRKR